MHVDPLKVYVAAAGRFLHYFNGGPDGLTAGAHALFGNALLEADAEGVAGGIVPAVLHHKPCKRSGRDNSDYPDCLAAAWQCVTSPSNVSAE